MGDSLIEKQKRLRSLMLERIFEASGGDTSKWVELSPIAKNVGIEEHEAHVIADQLEGAGYIWMPEQRIYCTIKNPGIAAYQKLKTPLSTPTYQNNSVTIFGDSKAPVQIGGSHNTQNVSYTSNDGLGEIIEKILDAVKVSSLDPYDKDEVIHSFQQIQKLSQQEKKPDDLERVKKKLEIVQSVIKTGTDLGAIVLHWIPFISKFFDGR